MHGSTGFGGWMIQVERLRKSFGSLVAVDDVSFTVAEGEIFGLLGPNGAGKTTAINMICGILKPEGGRVLIGGRSGASECR
jgi:ABC-type multidrug transport system ATPase subunit